MSDATLREGAAGLVPQGLFAKAALVVLAGATLGFASAWLAVRGDFPFGEARSGPWSAWPKAGAPDIDPYARASLARSGATALGAGEGLVFRADTDSDGRALEGRCEYRLSGPLPMARFWTLALTTRDGRPAPNAAHRHAFVSSDVLRDAQGEAAFVVAPTARAGNWLPSPANGHFALALSLYDTPLAASASAIKGVELPRIERGDCA